MGRYVATIQGEREIGLCLTDGLFQYSIEKGWLNQIRCRVPFIDTWEFTSGSTISIV